ncbi:hypothetical protein P7K49_027584, partial [Saguinus oedipus]
QHNTTTILQRRRLYSREAFLANHRRNQNATSKASVCPELAVWVKPKVNKDKR